ncbi:P5 [Emaravirus kiwii]|uniref:P5 n=1 Tax=Emaravirus kiwii TaxID=2660760 RepID=A0A5Q5AR50_9VIRU|nr:P5 [Emaravirus kiwii]QEE82890.1 P5 [Emaravirus kiwii]
MDCITPFSFCNKAKFDSTGYERIPKLTKLGKVEKIISDTIVDEFNSCDELEKGFFYDEFKLAPVMSSINYIEVNEDMPKFAYAIQRRGLKKKHQYAILELNEILTAALNSCLYSHIIKEFENDFETIYATIKGIAPYMHQFFIVKVLCKETLVKAAKENWNNIIMSTSLVDRESIIDHYKDMSRFYYKVVKNQTNVGSVYKFIDDNKHLMGHMLPFIDIKPKSYDQEILNLVNKHIDKCIEMNDYDIIFKKETISEEYPDKDFQIDVSNAIYLDVTLKLREIREEHSELECLKVCTLRKKKTNTKERFQEIIGSDQEMISHKPGENKDEDIFYYGLPETLNVVCKHVEKSMVKNLVDEDMIDDIDYISNYPFKQDFKKVVFRLYKDHNNTVRMSQLGLQYCCLYIYYSALSTKRSGIGELQYSRMMLEKARTFSKVNVAKLRSKVMNMKHYTRNSDCVSLEITNYF